MGKRQDIELNVERTTVGRDLIQNATQVVLNVGAGGIVYYGTPRWGLAVAFLLGVAITTLVNVLLDRFAAESSSAAKAETSKLSIHSMTLRVAVVVIAALLGGGLAYHQGTEVLPQTVDGRSANKDRDLHRTGSGDLYEKADTVRSAAVEPAVEEDEPARHDALKQDQPFLDDETYEDENATCIPSARIVSFECPAFSTPKGRYFGDREVLSVCGEFDKDAFVLLVRARKDPLDKDSIFDERDYQLRVSKIDDPSCGQGARFRIVSDAPTGVGTDELTFKLNPPLRTGERYCVTASPRFAEAAKVRGDSKLVWWWSAKVDVDPDASCARTILPTTGSHRSGDQGSPRRPQDESGGIDVTAPPYSKRHERQGEQFSGNCAATTYWKPVKASETVSVGHQRNARIDEPVRVEVRENGPGLQFRACKVKSKFKYNIGFDFTGSRKFVDPNAFHGFELWTRYSYPALSTKGASCSQWEDLKPLPLDIQPGERYTVKWTIVSPQTSLTDWENLNCTAKQGATGTCFFGSEIIMERTCK